MSSDPPGHAQRDVAVLIRDAARVAAAVAQAQADAVRRHRLLGLPLPEWRDGRVVEASAAPAPGERQA